MEEYKDAENVFTDETVSSPAEFLPDTPPLPDPPLSDEKTDIKHRQKAVTDHTKAVVEQYGLLAPPSMEIQKPPSSQNSTKPGFVLENAPTSSLKFCGLSPSDLSHISKEMSDDIPPQHEVQNCAPDGLVNIPKEVENVSDRLQDGCSDGVSDIQMNKAQLADDSTASADGIIVSSTSEKLHNTLNPDSSDALKGMLETVSIQSDNGSSAGVADSQTNRSSDVEEISKAADKPPAKLTANPQHNHIEAQNVQVKTSRSAVSPEQAKKVSENRGYVDTTAPFESVKEAVTKFGGIVDWKAHKALTKEKHKHFSYELEKAQEELPTYRKKLVEAEVAKTEVLKELETTRRLIEELKLNLERAETEEAQAKQDAELAQLRAKEIADGITDDVSVAAKTQLEVAKARHEAAVLDLKSVQEELFSLQEQYSSSISDREVAIKRAEEAVSASKEMEKAVEDLTLELIITKELLESAHAAHIEAEEHRIGAALAKDQDCRDWEKEVKQAEGELRMLEEQLSQSKNLEESLKTASTVLADLKNELSLYLESKLKEQLELLEEKDSKDDASDESKRFQSTLASKREELEEVKISIEKAKTEVSILRVADSALKSELEREKASLASMRQREGMASVAVSSLEAEIERIKKEIQQVMEEEREAREKMVELPKLLQQAAVEADRHKSSAKMAREELKKASEEAEQAKSTLSTTQIRLQASLKEIEAARASERLALAAVKALKESEEAAAMGESPRGVTLPLEEYYSLSKRAHEAEEFANERITAAIAQIQLAKESESKSLLKFKEACAVMNQKKEELRVAAEKAERSKEGKLGVEQELRQWRAEHEQRRKAGDSGGYNVANPPKTPARTSEETVIVAADVIHPSPGPLLFVSGNKKEHVIPEFKPRKKSSFFPRIVMFLVRRRSKSRSS